MSLSNNYLKQSGIRRYHSSGIEERLQRVEDSLDLIYAALNKLIDIYYKEHNLTHDELTDEIIQLPPRASNPYIQ